MPYPKHLLATLGLILLGAQLSVAQLSSKGPTTWWPDPSTGLMWTGQTTWGLHKDKNWEQARDYCTSLKLGGFSGWRLPTLNEVKEVTTYRHVVPVERARNTGPHTRDSAIIHSKSSDFFPQPYEQVIFKGGILVPDPFDVWTSIVSGSKAWTFEQGASAGNSGGGDPTIKLADLTATWFHTAICTRQMEPDLLQISKDAQVGTPVPDLQTLKANVPLAKAKLAYQAAQYQDSITQSKNALVIKSDFAPAYWGIGISYGKLGQWDLAISNLESALKINKGYSDAKISLKWAKAAQKAAKKGATPKEQPPVWN